MLRSPIQACVLWTETNLPFSHLVIAQRVYYQCSIYRDLFSQRLRPHSCVRDPCRTGHQAIWSQGQLPLNRRRVSNSKTPPVSAIWKTISYFFCDFLWVLHDLIFVCDYWIFNIFIETARGWTMDLHLIFLVPFILANLWSSFFYTGFANVSVLWSRICEYRHKPNFNSNLNGFRLFLSDLSHDKMPNGVPSLNLINCKLYEVAPGQECLCVDYWCANMAFQSHAEWWHRFLWFSNGIIPHVILISISNP